MPGGKHDNTVKWAPEEIKQLKQKVQEYGRKWTRIGQEMGRTRSSVRGE